MQQISCNESLNVRLSLTATPDITSNPVDVVLALDRSGSMAGSAIANQKNGAKAFVDIIYGATGGTDGQIEVNESISYTVTEGNVVNFPSPTIACVATFLSNA